jgi:hypothetical protein
MLTVHPVHKEFAIERDNPNVAGSIRGSLAILDIELGVFKLMVNQQSYFVIFVIPFVLTLSKTKSLEQTQTIIMLLFETTLLCIIWIMLIKL